MRTPPEAVPPLPRGYRPNKPHQWTIDELDTLLGFIIDRATGLRTELHQAWGRVVDWTPGLSAGSGVNVSGGRYGDDGANNGRTPTLALKALTDDSSGVAQDFHIIALGAVQASRVVGRMTAATVRLRVAEPTDDVVEQVLPRGMGECTNPACRMFCDGRQNRRRNGLCPACDAYARERKHLPREDAMRPHRLTHREPVEGCKLCRRDALLAAGHDANDVVSLVDQGGQ